MSGFCVLPVVLNLPEDADKEDVDKEVIRHGA
jgi:hypothetical protein